MSKKELKSEEDFSRREIFAESKKNPKAGSKPCKLDCDRQEKNQSLDKTSAIRLKVVEEPACDGRYILRGQIRSQRRRQNIAAITTGLLSLAIPGAILSLFAGMQIDGVNANEQTIEVQTPLKGQGMKRQTANASQVELTRLSAAVQEKDNNQGTFSEAVVAPEGKEKGHPVLCVDGTVVGALDTYEDYKWVRDTLLDVYTHPVAGGKPWKRGFVEELEILYQQDTSGILTREEALELLSPMLNIRLREKLYQNSEIPFATITLEDDSLPKGETRIANEGQNGLREEVYEVISINGKEVERNLLSSHIVTAPVSRVVMEGTKVTSQTSPAASAKPSAPVAAASPAPAMQQQTLDVTPNAQSSLSSETGNASMSELSSEIIELDDETALMEIPEEETTQPAQTAVQPSNNANNDDGTWPSAKDSAFSYPMPEDTWASNPSMGAGKYYPGIHMDAISSEDKTQGIAGPSAPVTFSSPLKGNVTISSYFGWRPSYGRIHYGLDYSAPLDTPIYASARGTVTQYTKPEGGGSFGKVVEINHGGGFDTIYAHCNSVVVAEGDHVEQGDIIGYVGKTAATAVHLHFEIRYKGIPYNPLLGYLE